MKFEVKNVSAGYLDTAIVHDVSFTLESGEILCLLGPNGVGKTTLFKSLLGFIPFMKGGLYLDDKLVDHRNRKEMASFIGYVPQAHEPPFPFEVLDVVVMGSISRVDMFTGPTKQQYKEAETILEMLEVDYLKNRVYTEVSGGERQMVLIARALMQNPAFLVMDEPTSSLDFGNQMRVLSHVKALAENGVGIIMTTHFPDHSFWVGDKAAIMSRNRPFFVDTVEKVVTEESLGNAYGIPVRINTVAMPEHPDHRVKTCVPLLKTKKKLYPFDFSHLGAIHHAS